jgi:hypothetical protein
MGKVACCSLPSFQSDILAHTSYLTQRRINMEFNELEQQLDAIHDQLLKARDSAEAGLELINKLMLDLVRENTTRPKE